MHKVGNKFTQMHSHSPTIITIWNEIKGNKICDLENV